VAVGDAVSAASREAVRSRTGWNTRAAGAALDATRLFVAGIDRGMSAIDADYLRSIFDAAVTVASSAASAAEAAAVTNMIGALADAVGRMREGVQRNAQPVPAYPGDAWDDVTSLIADKEDMDNARKDVDARLMEDVRAAAQVVADFLARRNEPLDESVKAISKTSEMYQMLANVDAVAWYPLEMDDIEKRVASSGEAVAAVGGAVGQGGSATTSPMAYDLTSASAAAARSAAQGADDAQRVKALSDTLADMPTSAEVDELGRRVGLVTDSARYAGERMSGAISYAI
jgi:hypothetical protein